MLNKEMSSKERMSSDQLKDIVRDLFFMNKYPTTLDQLRGQLQAYQDRFDHFEHDFMAHLDDAMRFMLEDLEGLTPEEFAEREEGIENKIPLMELTQIEIDIFMNHSPKTLDELKDLLSSNASKLGFAPKIVEEEFMKDLGDAMAESI